MTKREFLNAVVAGTITDEMIAYEQEAIVKLDEANARRKDGPAAQKKAATNGALTVRIVDAMETGKTYVAADIVALMGGEVSTSKVAALLKKADNVQIGEARVNARIVKTYTKQ